MRVRSIAWALGAVLALGTATTGTLLAMVRHEPAFYRRQAVPAGAARTERCGEFKAEFTQFLDGLVNQPRHGWYARMTDLQVNSYLEEDCEGENLLKLPKEIEEPRVAFEADRVRLGFRHGEGWLRAVIVMDLRIWLAPGQSNTVAVEVRGLRRGALPLSTHPLMEKISEAARQHGLDVTWYRNDGFPVAVVRAQSEQSRQAGQIQRVELKPGELVIGGAGTDNPRPGGNKR